MFFIKLPAVESLRYIYVGTESIFTVVSCLRVFLLVGFFHLLLPA